MDTFTGDVLGDCSNMEIETQQLKLRARTDDTADGWGGEWIKIILGNGRTYHCDVSGYSFTYFKVHSEINVDCYTQEEPTESPETTAVPKTTTVDPITTTADSTTTTVCPEIDIADFLDPSNKGNN